MTAPRDWVIHRYDRVQSTMDLAAYHARCGAPDRTVIVSAEQTAGRGRGGRSWQAPPGTAVFCTMLLRPSVAPFRLSTLPLVTGVAVAEALERVTARTVQLKWPNDVWIGTDKERRKVAGIVMTSHLRGGDVDHVLVGVGINVTARADELPPGAASVLSATGVGSTVDQVFATVLDRFDLAYEEFRKTAGRPSLETWRARAALVGELVTIEDGRHHVTGTFVDIADDGALLLEESGGRLRQVVAGDLTRGPRALPRPG